MRTDSRVVLSVVKTRFGEIVPPRMQPARDKVE